MKRLLCLIVLGLSAGGCTLTTAQADIQGVTTAITTLAPAVKAVGTAAEAALCPVVPSVEQVANAVGILTTQGVAGSAASVAAVLCAANTPTATSTPILVAPASGG